MTITNIKDILETLHKSQDALHMIGAHGIGKTEIVKQFAEDAGYHCEVLQLTVMDTGDLIGMPIVTEDKHGDKVTTWAKPVWLQRVHKANEEGKHCVVFLDELGRASIDIRQAALQMVLEGKLQEHSLGELDGLKSLIVVADNPSDEYDSEDFDGALEDRFCTLKVDVSVKGWLKYAKKVGILPVITDYIAEYSDKLVYKPESTDEKGASPRAWEKLSDILKNVPENSPMVYDLIVAKVGETVGSNFFHFYNNYVDVVKPEDIIKAVGKVDLGTEEAQRKAAKKLSKLTGKIEAISAHELAEKMKELAQNGKISNELVVTYVASLNYEIGASIFKDWQTNDMDYLVGDFTKAQPNKWYARELASNGGALKKKED
jgi:hypothetical protein